MDRPARQWRGLLPLALACVFVSCTPETPDPVLQAGIDLLKAVHLPSGDAFADLNRFLTEQPGIAADAAVTLVESGDESARYAAVYVLGVVADDEEELAALGRALDDDLPHLRALAAGSLAGLGRKEALPVLIELLSETDEIPGSLPSTFVDRFASETLTEYTGEDFGVLEASTGDARAAARQRWRDWWSRVEASLGWDPATGRYRP